MIILSAATITACSQAQLQRQAAKLALQDSKPRKTFSPETVPSKPNYYLDSNWAYLPEDTEAHAVDVFYVTPTAWYVPENWNMSLTNTNTKEYIQDILRRQGSVFYGIGNIYAPYYRQAHVYSFLDRSGNGSQALDLAYQDVEQAFLHYMENFNQGRPFILAGHSQGTHHLKRLIKTRFYRADLRERFVVGYLVGMPMSPLDLENPYLRICQGPEETGCVVSWNTERNGPHTLFAPVTVGVNPLTWEAGTDGAYAPRTLNRGAVFFHDVIPSKPRNQRTRRAMMAYTEAGATVVPNYTGAQVVAGTLVIDTTRQQQPLGRYIGPGNYQAYDYNFFFINIRENARARIADYLTTHPEKQLTALSKSACGCEIEPQM